MSYLFVYGTLLQSLKNPISKFLNEHSEIIGQGYIQGKLYDVGEYPAAILSDFKTDKIYGTALKIINPENVFSVLDTYEGTNETPPLYIKKKIMVYLENKYNIQAWVYIFNYPVQHLKRIHSGDYLNP
ncbi:hypothetical protein APS56_04440 [Pseudalgibacter alginicilyticus]|uniref:Gamma-glutamylcyclotransferase AIG2-like domain-containing protein n=1 Tax=Pseudalgibacter alginicilyticus TaxID=1736674 RepID=A0A0P0CVJ7_9FLAO|nr:gamma-glutamylcyclotransferase family protein [Pseudalgibacter alginicilyticus]ALJ04431.1 hypothetical protein APS56_04440 [Pseudalgibacter alginicilyticus]